MRFKQYLTELNNIENGQAIQAHEPTGEASLALTNPKVRMEINYRLVNELYEPFLSPEAGIQRIRKVLHRYSLDLPALYDADPEGDEIVIEVDQFGDPLGDNVFSVTNWDAYNKTPDGDSKLVIRLSCDPGTLARDLGALTASDSTCAVCGNKSKRRSEVRRYKHTNLRVRLL